MVFSLFGKKPPPRKLASVRSAQPAPKPADAPGTAPPPAPADKGLDQTPPTQPLPDLDFTISGIALQISPDELERMGVREGSSRVHPVVEEAAILYANGAAEHAVQVLEAAIERDDLEAAAQEIWRLLFELYQILGMREVFERRALEFVVRFETSPPAWTAADRSAAAGGEAAPVCNLNGALSASSAKQFEQMQRILSRNKLVRLDVAKVNGADADGCSQLHALLSAAKKQRRTIIVENAAALAKLLLGKIAIGKRDQQPIWLLLLELLQQQGDQEAFEEWALNYAVTFEVSPPSWEPPAALPKAAAMPGAPEAELAAQGDAFAMSGEMLGACSNVFLLLNEYGLRHDPVVIDLAGVTRMDFVCAGMLLNTLSDLAGRGKAIRLAHSSGLVAALLRVVGINQFAEITHRRA